MTSPTTTHTFDRVSDHHQHQHQLLYLLHQQQQQTQNTQHTNNQFYHVPQHSRREKLRFPPEETMTLPLASLGANSAQPVFYPPAIYTHPSAQLAAPDSLSFPYNHQPGSQPFSLSLSSSSSSNPRRQLSSGPVPYGPFTGYAAVLGRSRFLGPARMLLEEICDVGRRARTQEMDTDGGDEPMLDQDTSEALSAVDHGSNGGRESGECHWKKTRLISMMEEVCKRYKQYYQQVQTVITSFESVAGLSNAAPFATTALKAMSKHFKCLKSMILNQIKNSNKISGKETLNKEDHNIPSFGLISGGNMNTNSNSGCGIRGSNNNNMGNFGQPHIWRPQRGLPERAVAVLRAWLFEHFLHPYPTDTDKQMLAKQTGLTRNQVSNWFINARVRLWKPMVEEIHNLEMRQLHKNSSSADKNTNPNSSLLLTQNNPQPSDCSGSNPSDLLQGQISSNNNNTKPSRTIQGDLSQIPNSLHEPINFGYNGLGVLTGGNGGNGGVSLTLGLQQNNRVCLAEPIPPNLVHRFGLDDCSDPYVLGSFDGQVRPFSKDVSGHLLHDFVG